MPQFIEGPVIGPGSFVSQPVGVTPGGAKEVFYDSSQARAAYYEQQSGVMEQGSAAVTPEAVVEAGEPWAAPGGGLESVDEGIDAALLRAAANGSLLTEDLIRRLPGGTPQPPRRGRPPRQMEAAVAPYTDDSKVGLTVRVGKGIVASVSFSGGEPTKRHWARLLRFIEIAAEELDDDEPETEAARSGGIAAVMGSLEEAGVEGERGLPRALGRRRGSRIGAATGSG